LPTGLEQMIRGLDREKVEQAMRNAERALAEGHPDTRAGRFNPNLGKPADPSFGRPAKADRSR